MTETEPRPLPAYVLMTGKLSLAALEELRRRVKAGENEISVRAELHLRERKGSG